MKQASSGPSDSGVRLKWDSFFLLFIGIVVYAFAWIIVAWQSDPTWWWYVPVYGAIQIFGESVWWGLFHVGILPAVILVGLLLD